MQTETTVHINLKQIVLVFTEEKWVQNMMGKWNRKTGRWWKRKNSSNSSLSVFTQRSHNKQHS